MGLITKGMGAILRNRASKKALKTARGTTKLQHPVIKSVKPTKKSLSESKEAGYSHHYIKNIDEINKHKAAIQKGEKAIESGKKGIKKMKATKRAYTIGSYSAPSDPRKGPKNWDK